METVNPPFLDVPALLESSEPRSSLPWARFLISAIVAAVGILWLFNNDSNSGQQSAWEIVLVGLILCVAGMTATLNILAARKRRATVTDLEAIEELIQLRRWPEAAIAVQSFLSTPSLSIGARAQALLFLAMVLARYHRFDESVTVHDYILEHIAMDDSASQGVRLGRAVNLLREDHLLDADRAIADLRRSTRGTESPGLALVEIYRDVKTGHPAEAIEMFEKQLPMLRKHLGHRVADAWALAARGYDMLGRPADAALAFERATLLMPLGELCRRYPEIVPLTRKFAPAGAPVEVA